MDKQYYLWLIMAFGAGNPVINGLLSDFGSPGEVYRAFQENRALAGREAAEKAASVSADDAGELLEKLENSGIQVVAANSIYYPKTLKLQENPPCVLFVKGNYRLLSGRLLSTAGSRNITDYTMRTEEKLCERFLRKYTLVSSLSYGCDELCLLCAVKNKAACAEILPCGFDHEYPEGSRVMRGQILQNGGCVVSEYLPDVKSSPANFVRRARIIGGISKALVIFQAGSQSGSLTAAACSGNVFFLPPHDIFAPEYEGAVSFVRSGAKLLYSEKDVDGVYCGEYIHGPVSAARSPAVRPPAKKTENPPEPAPAPAGDQFESELHRRVYEVIAGNADPMHIDAISEKASCSLDDLNEVLLDLEISGIVRSLSGSRYAV